MRSISTAIVDTREHVTHHMFRFAHLGKSIRWEWDMNRSNVGQHFGYASEEKQWMQRPSLHLPATQISNNTASAEVIPMSALNVAI